MIVSEKWNNGRGAPIGEEGGRSIQEEKWKKQIAPRVFDKTSSNPIILYLPKTVHNTHIYIAMI